MSFLDEESLAESDEVLALSEDEPLPPDLDDEEDEEESFDALSELDEHGVGVIRWTSNHADLDEPPRLSVL